jgi:DNA-binding NarL/FixJ family response regulator
MYRCLVLAADIREETEFAAPAWGVGDYLLKDLVSGAQLVQAVRKLIDARNLQDRQNVMADRRVLRVALKTLRLTATLRCVRQFASGRYSDLRAFGRQVKS